MRNYAKIHLSISDDPDWRALSRNAQHLYLTLLFSQTINNAGVADWRPVRISALAQGWHAEDIELDGKELEGNRFVVIDESTEEVLVRSFIRNDEILNGPKTAQGMANAFKRIVSLPIRAAVCREVARIRDDYPQSGAWTIKDAVEIAELAAPDTPNLGHTAGSPVVPDTPADTPSDEGPSEHAGSIPLHLNINHATKQTSTRGGRKRQGTRLPADWKPTPDMIAWVKLECPLVDGRTETENFKDWWAASTGTNAIKRDWNAAFRTWMRRSQKDAAERRSPRGANAATTYVSKPNAATVRNDNSEAQVRRIWEQAQPGNQPSLALGTGQ